MLEQGNQKQRNSLSWMLDPSFMFPILLFDKLTIVFINVDNQILWEIKWKSKNQNYLS